MKKYVTPVTEILKLDIASMICGSIERDYDISDDSGNNPYQNPDWADDGEIGDDGGLNSTAKGSNGLWSDFDDEEW